MTLTDKAALDSLCTGESVEQACSQLTASLPQTNAQPDGKHASQQDDPIIHIDWPLLMKHLFTDIGQGFALHWEGRPKTRSQTRPVQQAACPEDLLVPNDLNNGVMAMTATVFTLNVSGMTCASCAARVEKALVVVPDVTEPRVNLMMNTVTFSATAADAPRAAVKAISAAGYQIDNGSETHTFTVSGMTCGSCARRVENALLTVPGVLEASVNSALGTAHVTVISCTPESLPNGSASLLDAMREAVVRAGYQMQQPSEQSLDLSTPSPSGNESQSYRQRESAREHHLLPAPAVWRSEGAKVLLAALLTFPLTLPMLVSPFGLNLTLSPTVQLLLAGVLQTFFAWRFYRAAFFALRSGSGNMDLLVALGTTAAFVYSVYEGFLRLIPSGAEPHLYFESAAVIITLVRAGKWMEGRARERAVSALRELRNLQPETVRISHGDLVHEIPSVQLKPGDLMVIAAGDRFGADGTIVSGTSTVDEALVTGESMPRPVKAGDAVPGGAVNGQGVLHVRATATVATSTIARMATLVERAQMEKPPVQKKVDAVSAVFVPVVVVAAILTFVAWLLAGSPIEDALLNSIAVLVIACPCALGLATPTAVLVATSHSARMGILIRDALALEQLGKVTTVVFDKTGTLTEGQPEVVDWISVKGRKEDALAFASGLQLHSRHPLAAAVVRHAEQSLITPLKPEHMDEVAGAGVRGSYGGHSIAAAMGTRTLVDAVTDSDEATDRVWPDPSPWLDRGQTLSYLRVTTTLENGSKALSSELAQSLPLLAMVAFADRPRESARTAVEELHRSGVHTWLLSGDEERTAAAVASDLGVEQMAARVRPEGKDALIHQLQERGEKVAMVGDGINDAPALARADVGVAMGSGTAAAIEAAAVTLMRTDPRLVAQAIDLSRRTIAKIHQNLFWAFFYNTIGIPLAAAGYLSPMVAGAAMALSSVCVVTNTLLLRRPSHERREHQDTCD